MTGLEKSGLRFGFETEFINFFKTQHRIMNDVIPALKTNTYFQLFKQNFK